MIRNEIDPVRLGRAAALARWTTALLFLVMFIGTHTPGIVSPDVTLIDKILHFCGYATLAFCLLMTWELSTGPLLPMHLLAVWFLFALYGAVDEVSQIPVGRSCDGFDWLADILGTTTGLFLFWVLRCQVYRFLVKSSAG